MGRGRTDLLVEWPHDGDPDPQPGKAPRKYVTECKVLHKSLERTVAEGVEQTAGYMDKCGAKAGHLIVFDRREGRSWDEKVFRWERTSENGTNVVVWGM